MELISKQADYAIFFLRKLQKHAKFSKIKKLKVKSISPFLPMPF